MKLLIRSLGVVMCALSVGLATAQQRGPAFGPPAGPATQPNGTAVAALPTIVRVEEPAPIDLNTAIWERLMDLPGVNRALAQKIIDSRPYASKKELKERQVVPDATYKKIQKWVVANETKEMKEAKQARKAQEKNEKSTK